MICSKDFLGIFRKAFCKDNYFHRIQAMRILSVPSHAAGLVIFIKKSRLKTSCMIRCCSTVSGDPVKLSAYCYCQNTMHLDLIVKTPQERSMTLIS